MPDQMLTALIDDFVRAWCRRGCFCLLQNEKGQREKQLLAMSPAKEPACAIAFWFDSSGAWLLNLNALNPRCPIRCWLNLLMISFGHDVKLVAFSPSRMRAREKPTACGRQLSKKNPAKNVAGSRLLTKLISLQLFCQCTRFRLCCSRFLVSRFLQ